MWARLAASLVEEAMNAVLGRERGRCLAGCVWQCALGWECGSVCGRGEGVGTQAASPYLPPPWAQVRPVQKYVSGLCYSQSSMRAARGEVLVALFFVLLVPLFLDGGDE